MDSYLNYYNLLFIIEILISEFLFSFRLKKRSYFLLRYIIGIILLLIIAFFFPNLGDNAFTSSLMFFLLFILTIIHMCICFKEDILSIIFCSIAAYTMQHCAYEIANLALSAVSQGQSPLLGLYGPGSIDFSTFDEWSLLYMLIYLFCYFTTYWFLFLLFGKRIKQGKPLKIKSFSLFILVVVGLITNIVLNAIIVHSSSQVFNYTIDYIYNIMCCILLLFSQFSLLSNRELQTELDIVNHLRHQEKEQYSLAKENIDLINRKCHDLKHQIRTIGENNSLSNDTIKEIQESINLYDSIIKTGNEALDVILTEKSLYCRENGILLSYIVDAEKLNFIKDSDLYSLFGNALDNAIEAVIKIKNPKNRIIGIKIRSQGDLITINISNTYEGTIFLDQEGLPRTTKEDKDYHGFGLRSIKHIVSNYDGNLSFTTEDNLFNLNVLFTINVQFKK